MRLRYSLLAILILTLASRSLPAQIDVLAERQKAALDAFSGSLLGLDSVLRKEGVKNFSVERALFSQSRALTIAHAPALEQGLTVRSLRSGAHVVGVFVNTGPLHDSVTGEVLPPGAYVVRLRATSGGRYVFEFLNSTGSIVLSTPATLKDRAGFEAAPTNKQVSQLRVVIFDVEWNDEICVSFLWWRKCWPRNA